MSVKRIITSYLSESLQKALSGLSEEQFKHLEEIRIRVNKPVVAVLCGTEVFPDAAGKIQENCAYGYKPNLNDVNKILELISNFSFYAFEEELRNGFITLPEGHRFGITGKAVVDNGQVKSIKNINGFNIRISHEIKGCASKIIEHVAYGGVKHTMIISPPGCGKTTLLRDIVRTISTGVSGSVIPQDVGVVDERSEIAGCQNGIAQNDVGPRTDVMDSCPKPEGMMLLLRSMSPKVIAVDEIGSDADVGAICNIINAGVKILCTVHGGSISDILQRPSLRRLIDMKAFERFIVLKNRGEVAAILDSDMKIINRQGVEA